jgi:hypothetical protein
MSSPHNPSETDGRGDRLLLRAIFWMLALLLHIQAIRLLSPQFAPMTASSAPPLIVELHSPSVPMAAAAPPPRSAPAPGAALADAAFAPPTSPAAARTEPPRAATQKLAPAPFYHSPHALTRYAELVDDAQEDIPMSDMQEAGSLLLRLSIDRHGVVNAVSVLRSTLPHELEGKIVLQFYRAH